MNNESSTTQPKNIETLTELLKLSGSQYRLYDIGRQVSKLPKEQFEKVELNQLPYPTPIQGHACIAIAFWQKKSIQPYLWLIKLPLDERGLLNQGARNHLIAIIVEALGADLTQQASKKQEDILNSNPYLFTPAQYKLASLNSKIKVDLKQHASDLYSPFKKFLSQTGDFSNWQAIGVQGITDFVARINIENNSEILVQALIHLPDEVLSPVCSALENEQLPIDLLDEVISYLNETIRLLITVPNQVENTQLLIKATQLLRALGASSEHLHVKSMILNMLKSSNLNADLLITLSGRCWLALEEEEALMLYFEQLIKHNDPALFNSIFKDLVCIPRLRPIVFQCIRSEQRSTELALAIGQLFNQQ